MKRLIQIKSTNDIPKEYKGTPIELLLDYHNLKKPFDNFSRAHMLIGMCMDNRKQLHLPENFAFVIRTAGANLSKEDFKVSYALSVGDVQYIAIIGHTNCGMVNLDSKKEKFVNGLVENAGWTKEEAEKHFNSNAPQHEIGNEVDFILRESERLQKTYPKITVAPMLYKLEDNKLYLIKQ